MRRLPIILLLASIAPGPVRAEERVDMLVAYVLDAVEARQVRCEEGQLEGNDGKRVVCGVTTSSFNGFKADWDLVMLHFNIPVEIETEDTWTFRRGAYEINYDFDGTRELRVRFTPDGGGLVFAYEEEDADPYSGTSTASPGPLALPEEDETPPRMAGFGGVSMPALIEESHVEPLRSFEAQAQRIAGRVTLEIVIGRDGKVRAVAVLSEKPEGYEFGKAAADAVRQWSFEPAMLEDEPVAVVLSRTVEVKQDPPPPGDD